MAGCKQESEWEPRLIHKLTLGWEQIKQQVPGFEWLTHYVRYEHFPQSLLITCVFDTRASLQRAYDNQQQVDIGQIIQRQLGNIGIDLKDIAQHLCFDTEEACRQESAGNWNKRLFT